ncbi:MAG: O-sialoglycoprotein endopeptidase [Phascolarctobacterium sp.]|nr:O-sialoglycoprotein endopeptidase [Phascolarctobacterium sp.]
MKVYLGIDTSCYTTSVALLDEQGNLVADERRILKVKQEECGLQQSEMVYQHVRALPDLLEKALVPYYEIVGIGVSERPRTLADSYMPAFLVGLGTAKTLAQALQVKLHLQSHQENHLLAGLWSAKDFKSDSFIMLHASGGTTDVLLVESKGKNYSLTQIGGSIDLHAGQFIDRVGVALGLQFPAGAALEKLAEDAQAPVTLPVSVKDNTCSLSGPATHALRLLEKGEDKCGMALGVEECLGKTFGKMLVNTAKSKDVQDVLLVGGVSANNYICEICKNILAKQGIGFHRAEAKYSSDGAVGNAYGALRNA